MANTEPPAVKLLTNVASPGYWDQELNLVYPLEPADAGDVGGGMHQSPGVTGPGGNTATGPGGGANQPAPGGGGGGGGGGTTAAPPVPDWEQALIAAGMPPDLVSQIASYYAAHASDPDVAQKALGIVRASDWWKAQFPGFWNGVSNGLFSDEQGYRAWKTGVLDAFSRYYGRAPTDAELVGFINQRYTGSDVEQVGQGHAYAAANTPDLQYESGNFGDQMLTPDQIEAYGQYKAGKGNAVGAGIDVMIQNAVNRMQGVFKGVLAQPSFGINNQGLLQSREGAKAPDIGA